MDVDDYPVTLIFPYFVGPSIAQFPDSFTSQPPPWIFTPQLDLDKLRDRYGIRSFASNSLDTHSFARMLAKIALSFAVAEHGVENIISFLPDIILNDRGSGFTALVGSVDRGIEPTEGSVTHHLQLRIEEAQGRKYITCLIRLFSNLGAPAYRVVVGQTVSDFTALDAPAQIKIREHNIGPLVRMVLSTEANPGPNFSTFQPDRVGIIEKSEGL